MKRSRVVTGLVVFAACFSVPVRVAIAQRAQTAQEIKLAIQRRRAALEVQREIAARAARVRADQEQRLNRTAAISDAFPGLPFIQAKTVLVTNQRVVFMYLVPDVNVALPKGNRQGFYVWRFNMTEGASPCSLVFTADTAMRTADFGDIVKSARVRRCNSTFETQALACRNPVDAFVTRQGSGFRIEVADSLIFQAMKTAQPRSISVLTFSPLGRSVAATYNVLYSDPKVKADR